MPDQERDAAVGPGIPHAPIHLDFLSVMHPIPSMSWERILFCAAALGICSLAHGQVGNFRFRNDFAPPGVGHLAYIEDYRLGPMSKEFGRVELLDENRNVLKSGGFVRDGIFNLGVVEIPGTTPGGAAGVIIRAWDSRIGVSSESWAKSTLFVTLSGLAVH